MKENTFLIFCAILTILQISCKQNSNKNTLPVFKNVNVDVIENHIRDYAESNTNNAKRIFVENPKDIQKLNLSVIIDSISYIKLSNDPEAIVGEINKIEFIGNDFLILDRNKTKSLKKFNAKGEYLMPIGSFGKGPNEYIEPTDFTITKSEIIVYDQFTQRMIFYDYQGKYLKDQKVPFLFLKFQWIPTNHFIYYSLDQDNDHLQSIVNHSVFQSNTSFVLSHRGFKRQKNLYQSLFVENNFSKSSGRLFFHPTYSDTIFALDENGFINEEFIIDFGERKLPGSLTLRENIKEFECISKENFYIIFSGNYVVLNDYLYFTFTKRNSVYHAFYSKFRANIIVGNAILNDVAPIFNLQHILTGKENTLIGYVQSADIVTGFKEVKRSLWVDKIGEKYTRIAEQIEEEDNPILLFYHLKN